MCNHLRNPLTFLLPIFFIVFSNSINAANLTSAKLPLEYRCKQSAVGGVELDGKVKRWRGHIPPREDFSFILTIRSFSDPASMRACGVAIIAAEKNRSEIDKQRRDRQLDVCATIDVEKKEKYGLSGPILRYCKVRGLDNSDVHCQDDASSFGFSTIRMHYIDVNSAGAAIDSGESLMVFAGTCTKR
jgi:hypothetical protein